VARVHSACGKLGTYDTVNLSTVSIFSTVIMDSKTFMEELIKRLAETWGPSGYEHRVRQVIRAEVESLADEVTVDPLGNLICRVGSGGKRVMIAAHMDEIGVMATYREPTSGYLRFENIGGLLHTTLPGARVEFEDGTIGTIGVHQQWGAARKRVDTLENCFIDVDDGSDRAFQAGQPARFVGNVSRRGSRLFGRAMDDRVGCAVAIEAMRQLSGNTENELYFVFTVQEEVGLRGAQVAAHAVQPDVGIAVDVTATGDEPHNHKMQVKLGGGTAIKVKDTGLVVPADLRDWMVDTATDREIPYQLELLKMGSTDAARIQTALSGVPSGAVSIPCRYVHTTAETVDLGDVEASVSLLVALLLEKIAFRKAA